MYMYGHMEYVRKIIIRVSGKRLRLISMLINTLLFEYKTALMYLLTCLLSQNMVFVTK